MACDPAMMVGPAAEAEETQLLLTPSSAVLSISRSSSASSHLLHHLVSSLAAPQSAAQQAGAAAAQPAPHDAPASPSGQETAAAAAALAPAADVQAAPVRGPPDEDESFAAAAEQHRLTTSHPVDMQALAKWVESMVPFIGVLSAVFVYHFSTSIALCGWLLWCLLRANGFMRCLVARKAPPTLWQLSCALGGVGANAALVLWLAPGMAQMLTLRPPVPGVALTVWQAGFRVLAADALVRVCSVAPKLLVIAALQAWHHGYCGRSGAGGRPCRSSSGSGSGGGARCSSSSGGGGGGGRSRLSSRQARLLTFLEHCLLLYRAALPATVWCTYLAGCTANSLLSPLLVGSYLTWKAYALAQHAALAWRAGQLVLRRGALYGSYVHVYSAAAAAAVAGGREHEDEGDVCPICQDPPTWPVRLVCRHVFCECCAEEWFERQQSCPCCRASIGSPPGLKSFADGASPLLPQLA